MKGLFTIRAVGGTEKCPLRFMGYRVLSVLSLRPRKLPPVIWVELPPRAAYATAGLRLSAFKVIACAGTAKNSTDKYNSF